MIQRQRKGSHCHRGVPNQVYSKSKIVISSAIRRLAPFLGHAQCVELFDGCRPLILMVETYFSCVEGSRYPRAQTIPSVSRPLEVRRAAVRRPPSVMGDRSGPPPRLVRSRAWPVVRNTGLHSPSIFHVTKVKSINPSGDDGRGLRLVPGGLALREKTGPRPNPYSHSHIKTLLATSTVVTITRGVVLRKGVALFLL